MVDLGDPSLCSIWEEAQASQYTVWEEASHDEDLGLATNHHKVDSQRSRNYFPYCSSSYYHFCPLFSRDPVHQDPASDTITLYHQ